MTSKPQILLSNEHHKKLPVTGIRFAYNQQIRNRLKEVTTAVWSASGRCWYIEQNSFKLQLFFEQFRDLAYIDYSALKNTQVEAKTQDKRIQNYTKAKLPVPKEYLDKLEQKRYSANTIKLYCHYFEEFLGYFANSNIDEIEKDQIDVYILVLIRKNKISPSQQNQRINAIKFYYEKVLGRDKEYYNIERPHSEKVPPKVLNESKVLAILRAVDNYKHKAILSTIYSAGLRRSEIINLRKEDIDYDKNIIFIRSAKGKKDRITILSDSNARFLKAYQAKYRPKYWMFESPERKRYSTSSVAKVLNVAVIKAGLEKRITPHMLRHSFATHLLEQGVDMRYIQNLLGHESTKTTEIYTHVSKSSLHKIKSPLDRIFEDKTNDNNKLRK